MQKSHPFRDQKRGARCSIVSGETVARGRIYGARVSNAWKKVRQIAKQSRRPEAVQSREKTNREARMSPASLAHARSHIHTRTRAFVPPRVSRSVSLLLSLFR